MQDKMATKHRQDFHPWTLAVILAGPSCLAPRSKALNPHGAFFQPEGVTMIRPHSGEERYRMVVA